MLKLDHIVVVAERLEDGRRYVEQALGVPLLTGGQHDVTGTHNCLIGLEDGIYLEVIALDPNASARSRNPVFGLRGFSGAPRLTNWVCRSDDIHGDMKLAFGEDAAPTQVSRGDLSWAFSLVDEGQTPFDGLVPMMLDWGDGPSASDRLPSCGIRLKRLVLGHPDYAGLVDALAGIVDEPLLSLELSEQPVITAIFQTPNGEVVLR